MNPNDELNSIGYVSSVPDYAPVDTPHPRDEAEISTLEEVFTLIKARKQLYTTIESLSLDDKNFSIEQQLAINTRVLFHLQEMEGLVGAAITKVKEKNNGRNY